MYACYNIFNEENVIRESLESVVPYVEKVIAIDGAYKKFPHKTPYSTDKTKEIFHELCGRKLVWVGCKKAWPSQVVKRNEYLKRVPIGRWFLIIDGDEIMKGKVREGFKFAESSKFKCIGIMGQNHYPIWGDGKSMGPSIPSAKAWKTLKWKTVYGVGRRLFLKQRDMRYIAQHAAIYAGRVRVKRMEATLKDVLVINLNYKQGWKRWQQRLKYKTDHPTR